MLPNFKDIEAIRDSAEAKLEAQQIERSQLEHSLQSDYLALRKLVGSNQADKFLKELSELVF